MRLFSGLPSDLRLVAGDDDSTPKPVIDKKTGTSNKGQANKRTNRRRPGFPSSNMRRIIGCVVGFGTGYW
jgi:hypothetical protein